MNSFKKFAQNGALYTLLILIAFYLFAQVADFDEKSIHFSKFLTVMGFGFAISLTAMIFNTKLHVALKYALNYTVLCAAFCVVFIGASKSSMNPIAKFFVSVIVFSMFYGFVILFKKIIFRRKK